MAVGIFVGIRLTLFDGLNVGSGKGCRKRSELGFKVGIIDIIKS